MAEHLLLKWGTLKGWNLESEQTMGLIRKYIELGVSMSAALQRDTPEQKQILCDLIDAVDGDIKNDWTDKTMTKDAAKAYVREYPHMTALPDFEALRARLNAEMQKLIEDTAKERGWPVGEVWSSFDPDACYCACATDGPCEHSWDGPEYVAEDGCMSSVTCSRCGSVAAYHDMKVGP